MDEGTFWWALVFGVWAFLMAEVKGFDFQILMELGDYWWKNIIIVFE